MQDNEATDPVSKHDNSKALDHSSVTDTERQVSEGDIDVASEEVHGDGATRPILQERFESHRTIIIIKKQNKNN